MQELAAQLGLANHVTWTGMIQGDLKWGAFRTAEAFILPSHQENFGISVVEALACSLPVLISNQVNIWREIVMDRAGLTEKDNLEGTRRLLTGWSTLSPAERLAFPQRARNCFETRFQVEGVALHLIEILESIITA
jgi:glycosyltransferase involved in cell wall biosynthesis